jgi:RNA polymerase sigma-B factor
MSLSCPHSRPNRRRAGLHWRHALVTSNLGLVRLVAHRECQRTGRNYDDLCSAGYEGLIRAVECFDASRGHALSSFAVPYIRGAMLMDHRERQQPLRTPRRLRELQQRAHRLQQQRQAAGLPPLSLPALAEALDCPADRLEEAARVRRALTMVSLDQACGSTEEGAGRATLLDQLCDRSLPADDPQLHWLRGQLERLDPEDRELMEGRWIDGLSWLELAARLGSDGRSCRHRAGVLLRFLQSGAQQNQAIRASTAARAV